jgi:hypothetical protein
MNRLAAMFTAMALLASVSTEAQTIVITRGDSRAVSPAAEEHFTGSVRVEALFEALDPSHVSGGSVTFEPGARTACHLGFYAGWAKATKAMRASARTLGK